MQKWGVTPSALLNVLPRRAMSVASFHPVQYTLSRISYISDPNAPEGGKWERNMPPPLHVSNFILTNSLCGFPMENWCFKVL